MIKKIEKYDLVLTLAFKVVMLLFIVGLIVVFFYSFWAGDIWDKLLHAGITVGGIAGVLKLFIKFDIASKAAKNPENLNADTLEAIIKSLSKSNKEE